MWCWKQIFHSIDLVRYVFQPLVECSELIYVEFLIQSIVQRFIGLSLLNFSIFHFLT